MCDTYPTNLLVPKSATLPVMVGSSKFRSKGRFPTLSYYYKETQVSYWNVKAFLILIAAIKSYSHLSKFKPLYASLYRNVLLFHS